MNNLSKTNGRKQSANGCFLLYKEHIYIVLGICIAIAICMYGIISIIGFSAYPDEFGYWSVAAAILGLDWSEITGLGPYYSYGYSVLLAPVLFLFHNPIIAYRMAIVLNLLLQCASFPIMYLILQRLFPENRKNVLGIITSIAVLYPAWSFYTMTTMAEALLYFGFLLSIYLMLRFLSKPGVVTGLLLIIISIYLYLVHMRCIGVIGATVVTVIIWGTSRSRIREKKSLRAFIIIPIIILLFALTFVLKDKVIALLYHQTSENMLTWNDYSGLSYRISKMLSLDGILLLLKDICGKVLYLGLATYGIGYFGICLCVKKVVISFTNIRKRTATATDYLWIYIFLATLAQFMVALIYLNGASGPNEDRLDNFLHGRYIDFYLPILIGIGIVEMRSQRCPYITMAVTFLMYLLLGIVAVRTIEVNTTLMNKPHGFTMIGMSYLLEIPLTDTIGFVVKEIILQAGITLIADIIILLSRKKTFEVMLSAILAVQIILGLNACNHFIFPYQDYIYGDVVIGQQLSELLQEYPGRKVIHIYESGNPYIELVQFGNRDVRIHVVNLKDGGDVEKYLEKDAILIAQLEGNYEDEIDRHYGQKLAYGHLGLYYNP